jgi:hypothetical protein
MTAGAKPLPSSDETGAINLLLLLDIATAAHGDDVAVQVAGDLLNGAGVARVRDRGLQAERTVPATIIIICLPWRGGHCRLTS